MYAFHKTHNVSSMERFCVMWSSSNWCARKRRGREMCWWSKSCVVANWRTVVGGSLEHAGALLNRWTRKYVPSDTCDTDVVISTLRGCGVFFGFVLPLDIIGAFHKSRTAVQKCSLSANDFAFQIYQPHEPNSRVFRSILVNFKATSRFPALFSTYLYFTLAVAKFLINISLWN